MSSTYQKVLSRGGVGAIASVLSALLLLMVSLGPAWAQAPMDAVKACQSIRESAKRLACMDTVMKEIAASEAAAQTESGKAAAAKAKLKADGYAVLNVLRRLESRVAVGLSYPDYSYELSNAIIPVIEFRQGPSGKAMPRFEELIFDAYESYADAAKVWNLKFKLRQINASKEDDPLIPAMLAKYPSVLRDYQSYNIETMKFDTATGLIMRAAGAKLNAAELALERAIK